MTEERTKDPSLTRALSGGQRTELILRIKDRLEVIYSYMDSGRSKGRKDAINELLEAYSDNAVRAMHTYLMSEMKDSSQLRHRQHFLENLSSPYTWTHSGTTIAEYLAFLPVIDIDSSDPSESFRILESLHRVQNLPQMDDYTEAGTDTKKQITALLSATERVLRYYQRVLVNSPQYIGVPTPKELGIPLEIEPDLTIVGDDIIDLIIEYPERSSDITNLIINQGVKDGELLREKISCGAQSLRDGII